MPLEQRRNYKHCIEALVRIARTEGNLQLFAGVSMASTRGMMVTIGQLAFYDEFKQQLIKTKYFTDNLTTHFTASLLAGVCATVITMPLDVLKTRLMNAKPGEYNGVLDCARGMYQFKYHSNSAV